MNRQKIIVLQGVPASGKSTWAKEYVKDKPDWVIVNRDSIREATGKYWVPSRESYITKLEDYSVKTAIQNNLNVIIDATNLNKITISKWNKFAEELNADIEFKEFKVDFNTAYWRDTNRERKVGLGVLKTFFNKYYPDEPLTILNSSNSKERTYLKQDETLPQAIIVDIDGTLSIMHDRGPFDYHLVNNDLPNNPVIDLINTLSKQYQILIVTGREQTDICQQETIKWLNRYLTFNDWKLFMRKPNDYRKDGIIKQEIYNKYIKDNYYITAVFEDRDSAVKGWRDLGLLCNQVYYGDF